LLLAVNDEKQFLSISNTDETQLEKIWDNRLSRKTAR